eukprot:2751494-Alexandrium_andersonii.AAC.1
MASSSVQDQQQGRVEQRGKGTGSPGRREPIGADAHTHAHTDAPTCACATDAHTRAHSYAP